MYTSRIVISPHPDDAVWSCGGVLPRWVAGGPTTVVTVFDGEAPPATGEAPPAAPGFPPQRAAGLMAVRRAEDVAALTGGSIRRISLGFPEAALRRDGGRPLYRSVLALRRRPAPQDGWLVAAVARELAPLVAAHDIVVAPLGRGTHVDHEITRAAVDAATAAQPAEVRYYAEFPYAPPEPHDLVRTEHAADFTAWLRSGLIYRSQVATMFGGPIGFGRALARHARLVSHGQARWAQWRTHVAAVRP